MEKKKVSSFEFFIASAIAERNNDPSLVENIEPLTEQEEQQQKSDKIKNFAEQIKVNPAAP